MDVYKAFETATRNKLRVTTSTGRLSVEQLWDLDLSQLYPIGEGLDEVITKESGSERYARRKQFSAQVTEWKMALSIVDHIISVKETEAEAAENAKELAKAKREHNALVSAAILEAKKESLKGKTEEELKAMYQ